MNMDLALMALVLIAGAAFAYIAYSRKRGLEAFLTCPYRRARMLHRLERMLSEKKGITLAEHYRTGEAHNPARMPIAIDKDTRLLALYRERCVRNNGVVLLDEEGRERFNDEARRINAFYPEKPGSL